jgi:hypothetical protein
LKSQQIKEIVPIEAEIISRRSVLMIQVMRRVVIDPISVMKVTILSLLR